MQLAELQPAVSTTEEAIASQSQYVSSLQARKNSGETTISVFADDTWTAISLDIFLKIHEDKLAALTAELKLYSDLLKSLQGLLDKAIEDWKNGE